MPSLREYLARFLTIPGLRAAVLVGRDGLLIDATGRGDQRLFEALGALAASALGTTDALAQELSVGATIGTILEYEAGLVAVDPLGEHAALVTLSENAASLGSVRHTLYAVRDDVLRTLDG
jgi:hypothetical protein